MSTLLGKFYFWRQLPCPTLLPAYVLLEKYFFFTVTSHLAKKNLEHSTKIIPLTA